MPRTYETPSMPIYVGIAELADGGVYEARITHLDRVAAERKTRVEGWGDNDATSTEAFICYAALKRTGQYDGSFDDFLESLVDARTVTAEVVPDPPADR